jgi:hypothetical protein
MLRFLRFALDLCLTLSLAEVMTCCVNLVPHVEFTVSSFGSEMTLDLYVAKLGVHTNVHGGNTDRYLFVFPRGLDHVKAGQISRYTVNNQEQPRRFSESSEIDLKISSEGCEVVVNLFDADGQALPVSGRHRQAHCGQGVP